MYGIGVEGAVVGGGEEGEGLTRMMGAVGAAAGVGCGDAVCT